MEFRSLKRWLWLVPVIGIAVAVIVVKTRPPLVEVVAPTRGPAVEAVYATGAVEPAVEVRIAPRIAGRLVALEADEGDKVAAGALLGRIEADDQTAAVHEAEARLRQAVAQFWRVSQLVKDGWATRAQMDAARADRDAARATVRRLKEQRGYARLEAPAAGTVIRRDGEIGDFIPVNQPVFYLSTGGTLRITASVDEEDIVKVKPGQKVLIHADALPEKAIEGSVTEVTPKGDATARSFRVRIGFGDATALRIGMTAETNIVIAERTDALLVPAAALSGDDVWIVADGKLKKIPVTIGARGTEKAEILTGLKGGEQVVAKPDAGFVEGAEVRIAR